MVSYMSAGRLHTSPQLLVASDRGFTLLEVIMSLALMAVVGSIVLFGLLNMAGSFTFAKESGVVAGKAQLAMLRLSKEFTNLKTATGTANAITFTTVRPAGDEVHSVTVSGDTLRLDQEILTDQVNTFTLSYYDTYDGVPSSAWGASSKIIEIRLILNGPENINPDFQTRITCRNTP